jgi:arylsulfatase A-like enzyme
METSPFRLASRRVAAVTLLLGLGAACSDAPAPAVPRARNVVVILADDLGYADVSTYFPGRIPTPNIDRIGREGAVFGNGYVTASVCSPSRAGLLTGRHQQRFGFEFNAGGEQRAYADHLGLDVNELTLGDLMRTAGLHTGLVGKWHQGSQDEFYPTSRGFDEFFGFLTGQTAYVDPDVPGIVNVETPGGGVIIPRSAYGAQSQIVRGPDREPVDDSKLYLTEELTREALAFIERNQASPFFLYLAYNAPHEPFQVPQKYYDRFPNITATIPRVYAGMISALDDGVGAVLDDLDRLGLARDTLVLFLSDNGCATYTGACSCDSLRGGKITYYEGGVHVPFLARWPAAIPSGTVFDEPVSSLDIVPTALAAVGGRLPADRTYDGVDLLPYLRGESTTPHHDLFWRCGAETAMREGTSKFWVSRDGAFSLLFDLSADPDEATNLAATDPATLAALQATYAEWEQRMGMPAWTPRAATIPICNGPVLSLPY